MDSIMHYLRLNVSCNFSVPPMFWIPSQREAVFVGQDSVTVECHSEAFPKSINYWVNNKGAMLQSSEAMIMIMMTLMT